MTANVSDWITYAAQEGTTVTSGDPADQALFRAARYIRTRYLMRTGMDASDALAVEATYIAAGYELTTPGFWSTTYTPAQAKVLTQANKIQWTVIDGGLKGVDAHTPVSPAIDALLLTGSTWGLPAVLVA
jgi:hypothetical protein